MVINMAKHYANQFGMDLQDSRKPVVRKSKVKAKCPKTAPMPLSVEQVEWALIVHPEWAIGIVG